MIALTRVIAAFNEQISVLEQQVSDSFRRHPAAGIYLSQPGLGPLLDARVIGEFGDDPCRYATAKGRKHYASTSPITQASGNKAAVLARCARNDRLADAIHRWAFCSLPFAEVMFRRRKHGITEAVRDVPVGLFCFELLFADGQDLTRLPYPQRRARLAGAITVSPQLRLSTATEAATAAALDAAFEQAVTDGCEGLVCKSVGPDAIYQAGARGWQWIKLKRDYRTELSDTVDLVVVGAFAGRGRRAGVYGALLLAAYDADADVFRAVTKCGTGFSDAELAALPARLAPLATPQRPARVDARRSADVWFEPGMVLEVLGAELTLSPNHTAGWGQVKADSGLALRFPRFTGRYRDDKAPEDATTVEEIVAMYRAARRAPTGA